MNTLLLNLLSPGRKLQCNAKRDFFMSWISKVIKVKGKMYVCALYNVFQKTTGVFSMHTG